MNTYGHVDIIAEKNAYIIQCTDQTWNKYLWTVETIVIIKCWWSTAELTIPLRVDETELVRHHLELCTIDRINQSYYPHEPNGPNSTTPWMHT